MRGIILSGGLGTRLYPATISVSKQLMPVYDKPMIYYPLSVLMLSGIRDILLITTPYDLKSYQKLLKNGSDFGINIRYKVQNQPRGLADAFILGRKFIGRDSVCLILGDNIFYGDGLSSYLTKASEEVEKNKNAVLFTYSVSNPSSYGIINVKKNKITHIIEKPKKPASNNAVVGLYFYPNTVIEYSKLIKPSKRGELEITDINNIYIKNRKVTIQQMGRGFSWHDAGSPDNLHEVSQLIQITEKRMGYKIGCPEEIAINKMWINKKKIKQLIKKYHNSEYGNYLKKIIS